MNDDFWSNFDIWDFIYKLEASGKSEFPRKAKVFEYLNNPPFFIFMFSAVYTSVILYNIPKSMTMLHNLKSNVHISIVLETKTKFNGDY